MGDFDELEAIYEQTRLNGRMHSEQRADARLTADDVRGIRERYRRGVYGCGYLALAKIYGVSDNAIRQVIKGRTWKGS